MISRTCSEKTKGTILVCHPVNTISCGGLTFVLHSYVGDRQRLYIHNVVRASDTVGDGTDTPYVCVYVLVRWVVVDGCNYAALLVKRTYYTECTPSDESDQTVPHHVLSSSLLNVNGGD